MEVAKQLSADAFGYTLPLSRSTVRSVTNSPDGFYNEHRENYLLFSCSYFQDIVKCPQREVYSGVENR